MSRFNIELPDLEMCEHCEGRGFVTECGDRGCDGADFEDDFHAKTCYRMCGECCATGISDKDWDDDDEEEAELEDERLIDEMYRIAGIARPSDEQLLDDMYRIAGMTRRLPTTKEPPCPGSPSN